MKCPSCSTDNVDGAKLCVRCSNVFIPETSAEPDEFIGQKVGGRYVIKKLLGEGGMGRVYEAEQGLAGVIKRVAVKTLHKEFSNDPQVIARFNRECATMAGLKHPNTVRVEDFGQTDNGTLYIAMEFVEGTNLGSEIETKGAMPPERVERILQQICGALAEAHKQGIVHRDLKPDNVVLTNVGDDVDVVKLLDFGIARRNSDDAQKEQKLTQQGMVLGTPPYMSPEQFMGKELLAQSDIYSLAVMAYEMLTGRLPFDANTPWEWATKHMTAQPFPFETVTTNANIPEKMKSAIFRAMSKDASGRHGSVKEFFEDLSAGGKVARATLVESAPQGGVASTTAMSSVEFEAGRGQTQMGAPIPSLDGGAMSGPMAYQTGGTPGYRVDAAPVVPPVQPVQPVQPNQGGPNKGLLIALGGFGGLVLLVAVVMIAKHSMGNSQETQPLEVPSATATATVAPLGSSSSLPVATAAPTTSATSVPSTTAMPTATAAPRPTATAAPKPTATATATATTPPKTGGKPVIKIQQKK